MLELKFEDPYIHMVISTSELSVIGHNFNIYTGYRISQNFHIPVLVCITNLGPAEKWVYMLRSICNRQCAKTNHYLAVLLKLHSTKVTYCSF